LTCRKLRNAPPSASRHIQTGKGRTEQHQGSWSGHTTGRSCRHIISSARGREQRGWIIAQTIHKVR